MAKAVIITLLLAIGLTALTCAKVTDKRQLPKQQLLQLQQRQEEEEPAKQMLDAMEVLMSGQSSFDPGLYADMMDCMRAYDVDLPQSQNAAWAGIVIYSDDNAAMNDDWGHGSGWAENNETVQAYHNIRIMQPCNYASNMAYYRVAAQLCQHSGRWNIEEEYVRGLVQGFSALGMGSSFFHGSETNLGASLDVRFIDVISYITHQSCITSLGSSSNILLELSPTPRAANSTAIIDRITDMFKDQPVQEWDVTTTDIPVYFESFAGLIYVFMSLIFDAATVDLIGPPLMDMMGVPEENKAFIIDVYVPELRLSSFSQVNLTDTEKETLANNMVGTFTKLLYAFVWQEDTFDLPVIFNPLANIFGATLLKYVNLFANGLTTFPVYDASMQNGTDAYPGSEWCNDQQPHSKWHLESANGLLDLVYLADHVNMLITQKLEQPASL